MQSTALIETDVTWNEVRIQFWVPALPKKITNMAEADEEKKTNIRGDKGVVWWFLFFNIFERYAGRVARCVPVELVVAVAEL